jgi:hypothetical protein
MNYLEGYYVPHRSVTPKFKENNDGTTRRAYSGGATYSSEVTGTCRWSTMHIVGKLCQIQEWKKRLLIEINYKVLVTKRKLCEDVNYINGYN